MPVIRIEKNKNYTVMSNYHLKEKNMSLKAKGLMSLMLSLPDNWDYSISGLVAICKENETSVKNTLDELKNFGYLKVTKKNPNETKSGRFEYEYVLYEQKQEGEKQGIENLGVEILGIENQVQLNTNNKNTNKLNTNNNIIAQSNNVAIEPALYKLQLNDNSYFEITQSFYDELKPLYPAVDLDNEFRQMISWIIGNPKKRKTKSGIKRFITTWLSREQDKGYKNTKEDQKFIHNNYTKQQINNLITDLDNIDV